MKISIFHHSALPLALTVLVFNMGIQAPVLAQGDEALEEITVTGSRIARRDYTSQSPIVSIEAETFENRVNIGLEAALNQMPQFSTANAGSQSIFSAAQTPFPAADAAPGAASVNLRALGLNRSLILVDGRRVQPINGQLVVDLNTLPAAAIERVETITGGAAAVYGADAIAGVVNFIMKKDFEGMEFNAQFGISQEGDGEEMQFNGLIGTDFADGRGNVMLGVNYSDRKTIFARDRDWIVEGWDDPNTQAAGVGSSEISSFTPVGNNLPTIPPGFARGVSATANYAIDQNGNLFYEGDPLNPAHPYTGPLGGTSGFKVNPDGSLGYNNPDGRLQIPLERYAVFGSAHFTLTDHINLFTEVRFSETFTSAPGFTSGLFNVWSPTVPYDPAFDDPDSPTFGMGPIGFAHHPVPAALADVLNSRPRPNAPWTYVGGLDYLPNFTTETTSDVYQVIGGFNGDLTFMDREWTWEVYASHGKSTVNARQPEGFPYLPRIQNVFNSDHYGLNFDISSLPGFFPLAVTGHCTSGLPIFNADGSVNNAKSVTRDCADYVLLRMNNITTLSQDVIEGTIQGGLFDLPAGELRFALGADWRRENFKFDPDTGFNANQDFPNVVQNIILPTTVDGSTSVHEVYAELAIPIIKDLPLVKSFEIDPGVRYSDYNTSGGVETYKVLGDWVVNDWMRFRGGYQVANRAPNVAELFTPRGGSQIQGTGGTATPDPCAFYFFAPDITPTWGNVPGNPNRLAVQTLCQHLMVRDGAPPTLYVPGTNSADNYQFNVFGATFPFPFTIAVTEGNPDLESETANTWTAGVVFNSPWDHPLLDRLTLSFDFFLIKVDGAIGVPNHNSVYQQCFDPQYNSAVVNGASGAAMAAGNPACALIEREYIPGVAEFGAPRRFKARTINQGGIKTKGFDVQFDWGADFADTFLGSIPGSFSTNVLVSILEKYSVSPFPGADFVDYTGTTFNSSFDYQILSSFGYSNGPLYVGLRWQHLPAVDPPPGSGAGALGTDSHDQLDLFGRWSFADNYELRVGIDNLLNADPEVVGATASDANLGTTSTSYDTFGRRFFFGLKASF